MGSHRTSRRVRRNAQQSQPLSLHRLGRDAAFFGIHAATGLAGFYTMRALANGLVTYAGLSPNMATPVAALIGLPTAVWTQHKFGARDGTTSMVTGMSCAIADRVIGTRVPLLAGGT